MQILASHTARVAIRTEDVPAALGSSLRNCDLFIFHVLFDLFISANINLLKNSFSRNYSIRSYQF